MKSKSLNTALMGLALSLGLSLIAQAQINYQGRLTDNSGAPFPNGPTTLTFSVWDAATGGTQLWGPFTLDGTTGVGHGPQAELSDMGRFNVIIGELDAVTPVSRSLTSVMASTAERYIQIKIGANPADPPVSPRQVVLPAPRALSADVIPHVTPSSTDVEIDVPLTVRGDLFVDGILGMSGSLVAGGVQDDIHVSIFRNFIQGRTDLTTLGNLNLNPNGGNVGINMGNSDPTAKLEVRGDIKLGPGGQYYAPAGEEKLRIVRGSVNALGAKVNGSGFTPSKLAVTGAYRIDFAPPFPVGETPAVTANCLGNADHNISVTFVSNNYCEIIIRVPARTNVNQPFNFIAMGRR